MLPINMLYVPYNREVTVYKIDYVLEEEGLTPLALFWDNETEIWNIVPMHEMRPIINKKTLNE